MSALYYPSHRFRTAPSAGPIKDHLDELISPVLDTKTGRWEGMVMNVLAPNGQNVPVRASQPTVRTTSSGRGGYFSFIEHDQAMEVATSDVPVQGDVNHVAFRVVDIWRKNSLGHIYQANEYFDYLKYGYVRIGNVLIDKGDNHSKLMAERRSKAFYKDKAKEIALFVVIIVVVSIFVKLSNRCSPASPYHTLRSPL